MAYSYVAYLDEITAHAAQSFQHAVEFRQIQRIRMLGIRSVEWHFCLDIPLGEEPYWK